MNLRFARDRVSFGRHETFHLRFAWLSKGLWALKDNPHIFSDPDQATMQLGVGKNMVSAIKYWLRATQLITDKAEITELGEDLFDKDKGRDPYLEDKGTLWLLHWLIASNPHQATTIAWFFNRYHRSQFNQADLRAALSTYIEDNLDAKKRPSIGTIRKDISMLTRLYARSSSAALLEEMLDSPLAELDLITELRESQYTSVFSDSTDIPCEILGFALLDLFRTQKTKTFPIEELLSSDKYFVAPGTIFRLTEAGFMSKLEDLVRLYPKDIEVRETAGLRQLYILQDTDDISVFQQEGMLHAYYDKALSKDYREAI